MLWSASALIRTQASNATSVSALPPADRRIEQVNSNAIRPLKTTLILDQVLKCLTHNPWWIGKLLKPWIWVKRSFQHLMPNFKKNIVSNEKGINNPKKTHWTLKPCQHTACDFFWNNQFLLSISDPINPFPPTRFSDSRQRNQDFLNRRNSLSVAPTKHLPAWWLTRRIESLVKTFQTRAGFWWTGRTLEHLVDLVMRKAELFIAMITINGRRPT